MRLSCRKSSLTERWRWVWRARVFWVPTLLLFLLLLQWLLSGELQIRIGISGASSGGLSEEPPAHHRSSWSRWRCRLQIQIWHGKSRQAPLPGSRRLWSPGLNSASESFSKGGARCVTARGSWRGRGALSWGVMGVGASSPGSLGGASFRQGVRVVTFWRSCGRNGCGFALKDGLNEQWKGSSKEIMTN